ncbi:unnamed protein product [Rotaria sordida]|nr:unnamed protein product [Rotaria sordida]CAF1402604.1 unnamed protein product [Rotaria sordida]
MSGDKIPALKIMALGRPFKVGMLYDYKTDRLIPNILLWDEKLISNYPTCQPSSSSNFEIHMINTFTERENLLGIDNNLKVSVLAGLIDLSGSIATHVVTDIVYGAEIFLVFDCKLPDNENRTELHNSVKKLLKKTKALQISDIDQLDLSNKEKQLAETLTCQYYGDIQLESNSTSFNEAIKLLKQLPNLLGKNNENTRPKQVLIYPLYLLDDFIAAKKRFHQINNHILSKSVELLNSLHELIITLSDIKNNLSSMKIFYRTEQQLSTFCTRISEIEIDIRRQMKELLPKIRGTSLEERTLTDLFEKFNISLSTEQKLNNWIQFKTEEKNIFTTFINDLRKQNNIHLLTSSFTEVQKNFNHEFILRLIIHVTEENDPFLNELFQYLNDPTKRQIDKNIKIDC